MQYSILLDYKVRVMFLVYLQQFKPRVKNIQKEGQGSFLFLFFYLIGIYNNISYDIR